MVTLLGSLILALALPQAFGKDGVIFASVYAVIQSGRYLFLLFLLRGTEIQHVVVRALWSSGMSTAPWLVGAFTHGTARNALWAFAIAVEYAVFALNINRAVGRVGFEYVLFAKVAWDRPIGVLVLIPLILLALHVSPLLTAVAPAAVLLGVAIVDAIRVQRHPGGPVPPRAGEAS